LENIVFLKLKQLFPVVNYGALENGKELDFIVKDSQNIFHKYQVTHKLNAENKTREFSPFLTADEYLNKGHNVMLTMDEEEEIIEMRDCTVKKRYLLKWLLD